MLNILHVASFTGNIGDNANHTGFRESFERTLSVPVKYTEYEIRDVFWNKKSFDDEFIVLANSHDLVVVGGGNYFELWVESSATGTSFDMSIERLSKIHVPIIFNALGVDPAQGAEQGSIEKFRRFLDYAIESPSIILSCRNDGSLRALSEFVGESYANAFHHVPDSGFFTAVMDSYHPEIDKRKKNVLIQLAGDMLEARFPDESVGDISYEEFISSLSSYMIKLSADSVNFILVPHIFRDIGVINDIMQALPDDIRRSNCSVAPYLLGQRGQDYIFDLYRKADLVLGMRFHANVCGLGLGTPCIGLVNYRQIEELYRELDLTDFSVRVNKQNFEVSLYSISSGLLSGSLKIPPELLIPWKDKLSRFHFHIRSWLIDLAVIKADSEDT